MTTIETVAFGTLWVAFLALAGLVLILYRQVDKAYATSDAGDATGLLAGVEAPDIEVVGGRGTESLTFPEADELGLLVFLSSNCEGCNELVRALRHFGDFEGRIVGLVNGEDTDELRAAPAHVEMRGLAHPPDVIRSYGIRMVPHVYVVRGRTVLSSRGAMTRKALEALIADAHEEEGRLRDAEGAAPPVTAGA